MALFILRHVAGLPVNLPLGCPAIGSGATPTPTPIPGAYTITFASFYDEPDEFYGTVTEIKDMTTIPGSAFYDPVTAPTGGKFAVVFMTVTNFGSVPDDVGIFSFRLRDSQSRIFTMDFPEFIEAQLTAEAYFGLKGVYDTVMPGITQDSVFVFLTPVDAAGLVAERCPTNGCNKLGVELAVFYRRLTKLTQTFNRFFSWVASPGLVPVGREVRRQTQNRSSTSIDPRIDPRNGSG